MSATAHSKGAVRLWFFFSPTTKDLARQVRRLKAFTTKHSNVRLRPCMLVRNFRAIDKPTKDFGDAVKELRAFLGPRFSLGIWDAEGLRLARTLGIKHLPAYALMAGQAKSDTGKAHLAYGQGADLEELWRCR